MTLTGRPGRLFIECTAACNISCIEACCAPETGIARTRQAGMLDFELFRRVLEEAGPSLGRIDFFNYGETFLHRRAIEMCELIKARYPHIYLYTSSNGLAFDEDKVRRLVRSGIDELPFSIDGTTQESYARYRQRGRLEVALRNLRAAVDEKRRLGLDVVPGDARSIADLGEGAFDAFLILPGGILGGGTAADDRAVLSAAMPQLQPGGKLLASVPHVAVCMGEETFCPLRCRHLIAVPPPRPGTPASPPRPPAGASAPRP